MKSAWLAGVLTGTMAGVAVAGEPPEPTPLKLFLFGGQSNMVGYLGMDELVFDGVDFALPQTDVLYDYRCDYISRSGGWSDLEDHEAEVPFSSYGSELSFGRFLKDTLPGEEIAVLKLAVGGANLTGRWLPANNDVYPDVLAYTYDAIDRLTLAGYDVEVAGFGWVHGDGDMWDINHATAYDTNLATLVNTMRADLLAPDMHVMVSQMHVNHNKPGSTLAAMRQSKIDYVNNDGNASLIFVDDLNFRDNGIHFDGTARLTIGQRMVDAYLASFPPPCDADLNNDGFLDSGDINVYVTQYMTNDPAADLNNDGFLDSGDISAFIALYLAGCP